MFFFKGLFFTFLFVAFFIIYSVLLQINQPQQILYIKIIRLMLPNSFGFPYVNLLYQSFPYSLFNCIPSQPQNFPPLWNCNTLPMNNIFQIENAPELQQPVKIQTFQDYQDQAIFLKLNERKNKVQIRNQGQNIIITYQQQQQNNKKFKHLKYYDPLQAPMLTSYQEEDKRQKLKRLLNINQTKKSAIINQQVISFVEQNKDQDESSPFIIIKNANKKKPRRLMLAQIRKLKRSQKQQKQITSKNCNKKNALRPLLLKQNMRLNKKIKKDSQQPTEKYMENCSNARTRYKFNTKFSNQRYQDCQITKNQRHEQQIERNQINNLTNYKFKNKSLLNCSNPVSRMRSQICCDSHSKKE